MRLVYTKTQTEVAIGDVATNRDGDKLEVTSIEKPRHGGSTGRVYVKHVEKGWSQGYYPVVIGAEWIEREDQA